MESKINWKPRSNKSYLLPGVMSYFLQQLETSFYFCEGKAQNYLCIKILKDLKPSAHQLANFDGQDLLKSAVIRRGDLQENPHSGGSTGAFCF